MNVVSFALLLQIASVTPPPTPTTAAVPGAPYVVVLKDGTKYQAKGPYISKGSMARVTLLNGQLVSLRLDSIDADRTRIANIVLQTPATSTPTPSPRKARITLTETDLPSVPTPDPKSAPPASLAFSGSGPEITGLFRLEPGLVVFQLRHSGNANFIVKLLDSSGASIDLLVNRIGDFSGSKGVRVPKAGQYTLNVEADGAWSIAAAPVQ